tara:strand:+ start:1482 stop:1745 length:264 start_codon:yes stop_codon:yes gene_type:complete
LVTSLASDKADTETKLRVANAAHKLIGDEAIQFIFQEMEDNLYRAFSSVPTPEQGEAIWREVKVVKALKENLEWYANQRETLTKRGR